jgi:hypothetical protein
MEEAPEKGKESSHSAHANGMNEWLQTLPTLCNRYVPEGLLQVTTQYIHGQLLMYTQVSPNEIFTELYSTKSNSSFYIAFISTVGSVNKRTTIMTWNTSAQYYNIFLTKINTSRHWNLYQHGRQSKKVNIWQPYVLQYSHHHTEDHKNVIQCYSFKVMLLEY